ncbi:hypothetical protein [Acetobacter sp. P1H12_c]|uniref:hypothetical protein n=1 Tax=Acetobacter sp. P1H12_c TaxID=2762621 RepID=UPI001C04D437|nr:hypothetical protein [Acetobacter sp. P1H12_c]
MDNMTAEAFLKPRLEVLVRDADKAGYSQDVTVALLISLLDTLNFGADPNPPSDQGGAA